MVADDQDDKDGGKPGESGRLNFDHRDELERWLNEQPREVSVAIAARAALRALPLLATDSRLSGKEREKALSTLVLPVFRAMAAPWAAARYPAHGAELRTAAADAYAAAAAAAYAAFAAAAAAAADAAAADAAFAAFAADAWPAVSVDAR